MTDILKVNGFETDTDMISDSLTSEKLIFDVQSNIHYKADGIDELLGDINTVFEFIKHHIQNQIFRLSVLDDYYKGRNTALFTANRRLAENKSDHRIAHNFAKIITQFKVGYITGNPIKITAIDDDVTDKITEFNDLNEADTLNTELMLDVSKYGRAYEIQYRNKDDEDISVLSNVFETFVIYDTALDRQALMGVRYVKVIKDTKDYYNVTLYTDKQVIQINEVDLTASDFKNKFENADFSNHFYGDVPVIEYANNRFRMGDYEDMLSLFDAYDQATSDTANHLTDTINSLLVISGDFKVAGLKAEDMSNQIKKYNLLGLQSGRDLSGKQTSVDAKYISPELNVSDAELYKERLRKDIFTLSNVPDMTDQNFSGNSSGQAMKYKLFGFEQSISATERVFKKSLIKRYKLLFSKLKTLKESKGLNELLKVTFIPNLPKAVTEELKMLTDSGTPVSTRTKLGLVSFIDDADVELDLISEEEKSTQPVPNQYPDNFTTENE